ncbi:MAG: AAA family ATPase [Spirochaetota bacterium]
MNRHDKYFLSMEFAPILVRILKHLRAKEVGMNSIGNAMNYIGLLKRFSVLVRCREKTIKVRRAILHSIKDRKDGMGYASVIETDARKALGLMIEYMEERITRDAVKKRRAEMSSSVRRKLVYIADTLHLSRAELRMMTASVVGYFYHLDELAGIDAYVNILEKADHFAKFADVPVTLVSNSVVDDHALFNSGLFSGIIDGGVFSIMQPSVELFNMLFSDTVEPKRIFDTCFTVPKSPPLPIRNFSHLADETDTIHTLLFSAIEHRTPGVNILLYGEPGTGKTEYARSLLAAHGFRAVLLSNGRDIQSKLKKNRYSDDKPDKGDLDAVRIGRYRLCQAAYVNAGKTCIIFDEADSILNTGSLFGEDDKSGLVHLIENNAAPCIWIVNSMNGVHEAVRRRFIYSVLFRNISRDVTASIIHENLLTHKLSSVEEKRITDTIVKHHLSVGHAALAIRHVGNAVAPERDKQRLMTDILKKMTVLHDPDRREEAAAGMEHYTLGLVNIDQKPQTLIDSIEQFELLRTRTLSLPVRNINFLFHGPSGCGKSELSRYLAHRSGKDMIVKSASDLMNKYVGETEKIIRRAFREAEDSKSILVIDEADSFFQRRDGAMRNWEISEVNEMLNAMESFRGILICTTNFIEHFDNASMRRFAYKVRFDYLTPEQKVLAFGRFFGTLFDAAALAGVWDTVAAIPDLSIGDFKAVYQQIIFTKGLTPDTAVAALMRESRMKAVYRDKVIGFAG